MFMLFPFPNFSQILSSSLLTQPHAFLYKKILKNEETKTKQQQ